MAEVNQEIDHNSEFLKFWNDPEWQEAMEKSQKRHNDEIVALTNDLTPDMVNDIRNWRCEEGYTWRAVARDFYEKYGHFCVDHNLHDGNQISGMQLCEVAQKLLNQKTEEGWN